jgi:hypothetical protein
MACAWLYGYLTRRTVNVRWEPAAAAVSVKANMLEVCEDTVFQQDDSGWLDVFARIGKGEQHPATILVCFVW